MVRNLSISKKIFFALLLFNILGMVATILFTTIHFKNTSEKYHEERLLRKEQSVLESLDYLLSEQNVQTKDLPRLLNGQLNEISDINNLDINIYDTRGTLIASNLGLENSNLKKIPSSVVAKVVLRDQRVELDTIINHTDSSEELVKINSFNPLKNNAQETIAIVNIPYLDTNTFLKEEFNNLLKGLILIISFLIVGSSILAWIISNSITFKIKNLAESISEKDAFFATKPLDYKSKDEIKPLVDSYNEMLDKFKQQSQQLALIEREDAWREMAKQVAHEIKNPLTPMRLMLQNFQLRFDKNDPDVEKKTNELIKTIIQQVDILTAITNAFSDFARMPNKFEEEINVVEVTEDSLDIFNPEWIDFQSNAEEIIARMDKIYLTRVITNLVKNALQAIDKYDKRVSVKVKDLDDQYLIEISDNGTGIPPEIQDKIFDPKFTSKNSGMGLGLAMVKKIVEDYKGKIWFHTSPDGTTFFIQMPKFPKI